MNAEDPDERLSIVVVGASGDLARKKVIPALFSLYSQGYLPTNWALFGFARSEMTHEQFRARVTEHLTCRYVPGEHCQDRMNEFLSRCFYHSGEYDARDSYLDLYEQMRPVEGEGPVNRLFYMAIPPSLFVGVSVALASAGFVMCKPGRPWTRVVIEKPFGKDRASSDDLTRQIGGVFSEEATYRIDHYLGKAVIENLLVLRFANLVFEPLWHRRYVKSVQICWREDIGVEGRGGYFDEYGIIRDVMQNHLLQILALTAMEPPAVLEADAIRDEKVRVLRSIAPLGLNDLATGQYGGGRYKGRDVPGYLDDPTIRKDSRTPTFASAVLRVNNPRWEGVPFHLSAGKGLDSRMAEIRIQFREVPGNVFCRVGGCPEANQLVIRIQPDEAIYFRVISKVPGIDTRLQARDLDLQYKTAFEGTIPEAYETLLLEVMKGRKSLFIRSDELAAAWDVFTPVLHELERTGAVPEPYPFGSRGPAGASTLAKRFGIELR